MREAIDIRKKATNDSKCRWENAMIYVASPIAASHEREQVQQRVLVTRVEKYAFSKADCKQRTNSEDAQTLKKHHSVCSQGVCTVESDGLWLARARAFKCTTTAGALSNGAHTRS